MERRSLKYPVLLDIMDVIASELLENLVFIQSFQWFPWTFVIGLVIYLAFAKYKLGSSWVYQDTNAQQMKEGNTD